MDEKYRENFHDFLAIPYNTLYTKRCYSDPRVRADRHTVITFSAVAIRNFNDRLR